MDIACHEDTDADCVRVRRFPRTFRGAPSCPCATKKDTIALNRRCAVSIQWTYPRYVSLVPKSNVPDNRTAQFKIRCLRRFMGQLNVGLQKRLEAIELRDSYSVDTGDDGASVRLIEWVYNVRVFALRRRDG